MIALRKFDLPRGGQFSIPADWWFESKMDAFECRSAAYSFAPDPAVLLVPVVEIHPRIMEGRQHLSYGGFDRERMIEIFRGIASHSTIPPVDRIERPRGVFRYQLGQGTHRFYASIAAGFRCVPTVLGWVPDWLG